MLVHRRVTLQHFAGTHLYTWVETGTVRVKCLAQEHNTMSPARTRTRTTRFGVEHTDHETTALPNASRSANTRKRTSFYPYACSYACVRLVFHGEMNALVLALLVKRPGSKLTYFAIDSIISIKTEAVMPIHAITAVSIARAIDIQAIINIYN